MSLGIFAMLTIGSAAARAASCRIAMLGDSLTAGYGLEPGAALPVRLEAALKAAGHDCTVLNAGVSGDTSAGGLNRIDWVLADQPSHLIVELGGNDALRALPTDQLEQNLDGILAKAKAAGVPTLLAGMLAPPNLGKDYGERFAQVYRTLADRHQVAFYPFFLEGVALDPTFNQGDGIHPNAKGVDELVRRFTPVVARWLDENR